MKARKKKNAERNLAGRIRAWEYINDSNKKAFRKPGRMKP